MLKITYLYQDGFMAESDKEVLLFNYTFGKLPRISADKPLYVFISCHLADYYNSDVYHYGVNRNNVYYFVADDKVKNNKRKFRFFYNHILEKETKENRVQFVKPDQTYNFGGIKVKTLDCHDGNDSCAFLVKGRDCCIFDAGHLNDWSWPTEKTEANARAENGFRREIMKIRDTHIDAAFVILSPKQENMYAKGIDYIMRNCDIDEVYPKHFKDERKIIDFLLQDPVSESYRHKVMQTINYSY